MSIPNMLHIVQQTAIDYPQDWKDAHTGGPNTEGFIRKLAPRLFAEDPHFGLNGKRGDPNDISDDAINFKGEGADIDPTNGNSPVTVLDVIGGAGGPNPQPQWAVVTNPSAPVKAAWVYPGEVVVEPGEPIEPCPNPELHTMKLVPYVNYDENGFQRLKKMLAHDYSRRPQGPDFDVSVWAGRYFHNCYMGPEGTPLGEDAALKRIKPELCAALGIPVDNYYGE